MVVSVGVPAQGDYEDVGAAVAVTDVHQVQLHLRILAQLDGRGVHGGQHPPLAGEPALFGHPFLEQVAQFTHARDSERLSWNQ